MDDHPANHRMRDDSDRDASRAASLFSVSRGIVVAAVVLSAVGLFVWNLTVVETRRTASFVVPMGGAQQDQTGAADEERTDSVEPVYVGSEACAECHEAEYDNWKLSDHYFAMQPPEGEFVRGDFSGATLESHNERKTFFERDDEYFIRVENSEGEGHDYPIAYTFGWRPLQQYLLPFPNGRYQVITVGWDTEKNEWFDLYPDEKIDVNDELDWRRSTFAWNLMCAECHSTNLRKNYDVETNTYDTTYSEVTVGCEACHGPGSRHVELANIDDKEWGGEKRMGLTVRLKDVPVNQMEIDVCARCHSRRQAISDDYVPGDRFLDHYVPEFLEDDLYFNDGQIKDEVFVYGSFLQSRMYRENVRCSDCHEPHTDFVKIDGNALCTQCHSQADYDTQLHHHHEMGTQEALCIECHMPARDYMVVDPRRDHYFKVPRPDLTLLYGVPNACDDCHTAEDEGTQWAADWIVKWYGPDRPDDPHFAHAFAKARENDPTAIPALKHVIATRDKYGPMVRATSASLLGRFADREDVVNFLAKALRDRDSLVRLGAVRALDFASIESQLDLLPRAMRDRAPAVRIESVRILAKFVGAGTGLSDEDRERFRTIRDEFERALNVNADSPGAQLNLGVFYTDIGDRDQAMEAYQHALAINSTYVPAMVNLALLQYEKGDRDKAEELLRRATRTEPDFADGHYMLALLLAETPAHLHEAVESFEAAAKLAPDRAEIQYNLAAALQQSGDLDAAEVHYEKAVQLEPDSPDLRAALLQAYVRSEKWDEALDQIAHLETMQPDNPTWAQYRAYVESQRR